MSKYIFTRRRLPYRLKNDFIDCTNYRDGYVIFPFAEPNVTRLRPLPFIDDRIRQELVKRFNSVEFFKTYNNDNNFYRTEFFIFNDTDDETYFLVWQIGGFEI